MSAISRFFRVSAGCSLHLPLCYRTLTLGPVLKDSWLLVTHGKGLFSQAMSLNGVRGRNLPRMLSESTSLPQSSARSFYEAKKRIKSLHKIPACIIAYLLNS